MSLRTVLMLAVVVLEAGCPAPCGPSNCLGCCADGECQLGSSRSACGANGGGCTACVTGDKCAKGECTRDLTLDPDSGRPLCSCASGCCLGDAGCEVGTLPEACGAPRTLCVACQRDERCATGGCTTMSCAGCVDAFGMCQGGKRDFACGSDGGLCIGCLSGERCLAGRCVEAPCNASTCPAGCCDVSQQCRTPSAAQCGTGGATCFPCGMTETCTAGGCQ